MEHAAEEQYATHVVDTDDVDDIHDAYAHADDSDDAADIDDQDQQTGFPGGPTVTRVLTQYEHYVTRMLWEGEDYLWAFAALVFLYDNLGDGVVHDTRQLSGYMTLLQHFPMICKRGDRGAIPAHIPRACRWTTKHVVEGGLMAYRRRLDALLLEDVVFTPYDDDRANHLFVSILMFSRYLRCGGVSVTAYYYYAWYINVSHPLILPPSTVAPSSPHDTIVAHASTSSSTHAGPSERDRRAAKLVRRAINLVTPFSEIHTILSELSLLYED
uniref:Uncharacterized protein LOC113786122 n=1 Tax=Cicer arietinum TaxID=3827 RepID=A0A3Q7YE81_CICAR|nr:uncharacterized protein LOC113786122 [Cicer arietinum]